MKALVYIKYHDFRSTVDILYSKFGINCYDIFKSMKIDKPAILIVLPTDSPPDKYIVDIKTKNISNYNEYLVEVAKKIFEFILENEELVGKYEIDGIFLDLDPALTKNIEYVDVYDLSEHDIAILFVFNLR